LPQAVDMKTIVAGTSALLLSLFIAGSVTASAETSPWLPRLPAQDRLQPFPGIDLGVKEARGQDAVNRLGAHLPDVAAWYGKSADEFRKELLNDKRMRLDKDGRLFEVFETDGPVIPPKTLAPMSVQDGALSPLDQTFFLHSHPGANRTLYLDFTGATITNTAWNASENKPTIVAKPYDFDNNPAAFSDAELQRIQYIWQRVAEDYAPFDVDVTTEQPTQDKITRSDVNDKVFGTTVVITKRDGVYTCDCGGIAYIGVFDALPGSKPPDYYKPALVFYDALYYGDEKLVAEAVSHEAGHNMGLHHDGQGSTTYYKGQGDDPTTGWAPIMGVGYYRPLVQFSKGEYSNATNKEDDFVIAQNFGLPLRLDDYGSTTSTATPFVQSTANGVVSGSMDGVIETARDSDVFAITAGVGTLRADVMPANRSPDVDVLLTLLDSAGRPLMSQNQVNVLKASLVYNITSQGTYYLEVNGTGQGDPVSTGYSNYGSVGNFRLTASYAPPVGTPPKPVIVASTTNGPAPLNVTFDGRSSTDDGRISFWYWDFGDGNNEVSGTMATLSHVYQVAGSYLARLTVVDNSGLSASTTQVINVKTPTASVSVQSILMTPKKDSTGYAWVVASVTVTNQLGKVMPGVKVSANWNGIVSKTVTATTNSYGKVTLTSPKTKAKGCFNLTVTNLVLTGYPFNQIPSHTAQSCR
jgi:PKD repeat protein